MFLMPLSTETAASLLLTLMEVYLKCSTTPAYLQTQISISKIFGIAIETGAKNWIMTTSNSSDVCPSVLWHAQTSVCPIVPLSIDTSSLQTSRWCAPFLLGSAHHAPPRNALLILLLTTQK